MSETPKPRHPGANAGGRFSDSAAAPSAPRLCAEMADLAPAFALHALDPDDADAVRQHRGICPACARQLDEAERTAALLPFLVRPAVPPPDIKAALFSRIAQTQALGQVGKPVAVAAQEQSVSPPPTAPTTIPASRGGSPEERVARAARHRPRLPALGAIGRRRGERTADGANATPDGAGRAGWANWPGPALPITTTTVPLMLVLALVGGWAFSQYNRATEYAAYQDLWGTVGNVLASEDGTVYEMQPASDAPTTVTGHVIADPEADEALLMVFGLNTQVGEGNYEIWVEREGGPEPVGEIDVDGRGNGREMIRLGTSLSECRSVIVRVKTRNAAGETVYRDVLSTSISPDGPAAGGNGAQGDQSIGSIQSAPLATNEQGR